MSAFGTKHDIDASFATMIRKGAAAVVVASDSFFFSRRKQTVVLAARHAIPAIYELREFTTDGGLMSYGIGNIVPGNGADAVRVFPTSAT